MNVFFQPSPRKNKAYRATFVRLRDGERSYTDFGSAEHQNFTEHHDEERKARFLNRFRSLIEKHKHNPQAPTTLSTYILWSEPNIQDAITKYKKHFGLK